MAREKKEESRISAFLGTKIIGRGVVWRRADKFLWTWKCRGPVGSWIRRSGVQERGIGWRSKIRSRQNGHQLLETVGMYEELHPQWLLEEIPPSPENLVIILQLAYPGF